MKVKLKKNEFTAKLNDMDHGESGAIGVWEFDTRQGSVHVAPGEYLITTTFGERFAVTEAQFDEYFKDVPKAKAKEKPKAK